MQNEPMNFPDKFKDECGVFGIFSKDGIDTAKMTYYGLYALQHRGQESAGIAVSDGTKIRQCKGMGLVSEVFNDDILGELSGNVSCGHVRYSTTGESYIINAQPLVVKYRNGNLALGHNGNLTNAAELKYRLEQEGSIFQTSIDTEIIATLIAKYDDGDIVKAIRKSMDEIRGAYALTIATEKSLIGVRDPFGIRPLSLGKKGDSYLLSSESCAFDTIGAKLVREVEPGEIIVINEHGVISNKSQVKCKKSLCIFEYIYFGRSDSIMNNVNLYLARKRSGQILFEEHPADADIVMSVPDSGTPSAIGFSEASSIPYVEGFVKNRYVGRTFIQPTQNLREIGVALKLNVLEGMVSGKRLVLVDDSIVRGTTIKRLVKKLRAAGASEIHLRVSSPPVMYPCHFGIDTPSKGELLGSRKSIETIKADLGVESLGYLSLDGVLKAVFDNNSSCHGCFSGKYPFDVPQEGNKMAFEKQEVSFERS